MTALILPASLRVQSYTLGIKYRNQTFTSPFTGQQQVRRLLGDIWTLSFQTVPLERKSQSLIDFQTFLSQLKGQFGTFLAYDFDYVPRGVLTGAPLVNGGGQTGNTLITDGWTNSTTNIIRQGDYFSVNGEFKRVTADVNSDIGGNATITFEPPLRNSPADNAVLTVSNPRVEMRLTTDDQAMWGANIDTADSFGVTAIEVLPT